MNLYYIILFTVSLLNAFIYAIQYRKRFNAFISLIYSFVPIATLGYLYINRATSINEAIIAIKMTYIAGCSLNLFMVYAILDLSDFHLKKWVRAFLFFFSIAAFIPSLTIGHSQIFYKELTGSVINGNFIIRKTYGPLHTFYYIHVLLYLIISFVANIYSMKHKMSVSNKVVHLLLWCEFTSAFGFFAGRFISKNIDWIPFGYVISEILLLMAVRRIALCDVTGTIIDSIALNGETGFISFNYKFYYLGSNALARKIFPELNKLKIDSNASKNPEVNEEIISKIKEFIENDTKTNFFKSYEDKIYQISIQRMFDERQRAGYILYIQDDTKDQNYISLLNRFNDKLREEINQKTEHILNMHNNLILGMATMVERRDNSTGGHIKRTSEVVSILISEMQKDQCAGQMQLSSSFCHNIIKAAPMHDLGKIAVDDAILRKPGRFTEEEFNKMKIHAAEGAHIVHQILKGTDDPEFLKIAQNVAHYHHERWDGSGYPEGLKGDEIPIEARIMAVADVYDALVSKRVYKEAMSFEEADSIMMDSFGRHFDQRLEQYYVAARPQLECYYSSEALAEDASEPEEST